MCLPETKTDTLKIAGQEFIIQRITNIDRLLDKIDEHTFKDDERLPYWAELWPSAVALSEYILTHQDDFNQKQILELGTGLGLCGIAATKAGADVLFSDYEQQALAMTTVNFKRNFNRIPAVSLMDWRDIPEDRSFDVIIAADILYEHRWLEPVRHLLNKMVKPKGLALIAEPGRTVAATFFERLAGDGWREEICEKHVTLDNQRSRIAIHRMQKC